ncbi:S8 family peptidase [Spirosoma rigui]|uniref:S8 family peptidase n=1 Tax=Spirosoma rigui TaxID=564064 RepID=UPI0009AF8F1D|nr:S8 family peptidase [Spirosoma rigui]
MPNSPIQVVLNSSDFIKSFDKNPGGSNRDFYADNDLEFIAHKIELSNQLASLKEKQTASNFSEVSYAKLILKQSALAKSHRPTKQLFPGNIAPVVGGGDLGEIFVELKPSSIDRITKKIAQAEEKTRWKTGKDGKEKPNPSKVRSEVGAIEEIVPYTAADKRKFSVSEGIDWLSRSQTGGAYIVELFETPPPRQDWDTLTAEKLRLFKSFSDGLLNFGNGTVAMRLIDTNKNTPMIGVRLEDSSSSASVQFMPTQSTVKRQSEIKKISYDVDKHTALITFLEAHPLVKRISLPPIITKSHLPQKTTIGSKFVIPAKVASKTYPKIGIVDGGVSDILGNWIEDSWNLIAPEDKDEQHGTFIAGLVLSGKSINGHEINLEEDGCSIIDLDLLPKSEAFDTYYQNKPLLFFDELESAVANLKSRTGVRIFNFSLNVEEHVSSSGYSLPAQVLDKIAEENDVIFIISAGNTTIQDIRKEWPTDTVQALSILAASRNDIIKTPAESSRNLSVSALNPPSLIGIVPFAPSNYSCRGPGIRVGLKPDLAHVGGCGTKVAGSGHGLLSINPDGNIVDGCGTSYAAPNVAKALATVEHAIEGDVSRETLIALAIHNASLPNSLVDKKFNNVAKHLVGFGMPSDAYSILEGDESAITLVFANRIGSGLRMSFDFSWPQALIKDGKCFGKARLTVVSTPPFDYNYGSEFVRVNVDGYLRQQQSNGGYKGRLDPIYLPETSDPKLYEKNLIEHSLKWSPIKVSEKVFVKGVGPSSDWRVDVEYLTRDGETVPFSGIPFTAILTISDPDGKKPVFNSMRQYLQSVGVNTLDIKTATRVIPRV